MCLRGKFPKRGGERKNAKCSGPEAEVGLVLWKQGANVTAQGGMGVGVVGKVLQTPQKILEP